MKDSVLNAVIEGTFTKAEDFKGFLDTRHLNNQEKIELKTELEEMGFSLTLFPEGYFSRQVEQARAEPARAPIAQAQNEAGVEGPKRQGKISRIVKDEHGNEVFALVRDEGKDYLVAIGSTMQMQLLSVQSYAESIGIKKLPACSYNTREKRYNNNDREINDYAQEMIAQGKDFIVPFTTNSGPDSAGHTVYMVYTKEKNGKYTASVVNQTEQNAEDAKSVYTTHALKIARVAGIEIEGNPTMIMGAFPNGHGHCTEVGFPLLDAMMANPSTLAAVARNSPNQPFTPEIVANIRLKAMNALKRPGNQDHIKELVSEQCGLAQVMSDAEYGRASIFALANSFGQRGAGLDGVGGAIYAIPIENPQDYENVVKEISEIRQRNRDGSVNREKRLISTVVQQEDVQAKAPAREAVVERKVQEAELRPLGKVVKDDLIKFIVGEESRSTEAFLRNVFQNIPEHQLPEIMDIAAQHGQQAKVGSLFPQEDERWKVFVAPPAAQQRRAAEGPVVNPNYCYGAEDLNELMLHYKLPRNINWAYGAISDSEAIPDVIKLQCNELQSGKKLLIPVHLKNDKHFVGAMIEKDANGKLSVTWADSLPWEGPNKSNRWHGGRPSIAEIQEKFEAALGGRVEIKKPLQADLIIQQDGTSCGPCVIQNLMNISDPDNKFISRTNDLRARQMQILGEDFSIKQRINIDDYDVVAQNARILELREQSALHRNIDRKILEQAFEREILAREPVAPVPLGKVAKKSLMDFIKGDETEKDFLISAFRDCPLNQVKEIMDMAATRGSGMVQNVGALFGKDQRWKDFGDKEVRRQDESKDLLTKLSTMPHGQVINFILEISKNPSKILKFVEAFPEENRAEVRKYFEPVDFKQAVRLPNLPELARKALSPKSSELRAFLSAREPLVEIPVYNNIGDPKVRNR